MRWQDKLISLTACAVLLAAGGTAPAARARFHYVPVDALGNTVLQPRPMGGPGERISWFGAVREPYPCQFRPNYLVTFCHPCTGRRITLPLYLPPGTPRIEYRGDRVIYNYGSFTVEVHFLADGSADVIYNSGLLRDI